MGPTGLALQCRESSILSGGFGGELASLPFPAATGDCSPWLGAPAVYEAGGGQSVFLTAHCPDTDSPAPLTCSLISQAHLGHPG